MAAVSVVEINADLSFVAATAGGDTVVSGTVGANHQLDGVYLLVNNADTGAHIVTIDGHAYTVGAGEIHALPCNRGVYPGKALAVTYDGVTSVTVAAFRT